MKYYKKFFKHLHTINKHKFLVMKYCFKAGLYWQGIIHDLSKYSPIEFFTSVKYFQGDRSPIDAEKEDKGYSLAWQHHKGHNPHHWEYWIDNIGPRETEFLFKTIDGLELAHREYRSNPTALEIPLNYVIEMICDWIAAGKTYLGKDWTISEPFNYYKKLENTRLINENTKIILENILVSIRNVGIDKTFYILKHNYGELIDYEHDSNIKSWKQKLKENKKN